MSTFSGDIGREEEDGAGWGGLVPDKREKSADSQDQRIAGLAIQLENALRDNQALKEALTKLIFACKNQSLVTVFGGFLDRTLVESEATLAQAGKVPAAPEEKKPAIAGAEESSPK